MTRGFTITKTVHFGCARRGRKVMHDGTGETTPHPGRVPRVTRLMALAIYMDDLIHRGEVADYAELARMAHVTRARITQIMNLLHLAPDIQEWILDLPKSAGGRDVIAEHDVRPIVVLPNWKAQRREWEALRRRIARHEPGATADRPASIPAV